jgi:hypothetical protein
MDKMRKMGNSRNDDFERVVADDEPDFRLDDDLPFGDGADALADWLANGDEDDELAIRNANGQTVREELAEVRALLETLTNGLAELRETISKALATPATKSPA